MKKYIKILPIIIFPYFYLITLIFAFFFTSLFNNKNLTEIMTYIYLITQVVFFLLSFIIAIINSVKYARLKGSAKESAKINLVVKGFHIPAYILHFILGAVGMIIGIFGLGFLLFAIFIDLITIILSGINSIGCSIRMSKDGVMSKKRSILMGIGSFIYCFDIIIAIFYYIAAAKEKPPALPME